MQVLALSVTASLASIVLGTLISRSLLSQLGGEPDYASEVTARIAAGDLTVEVQDKGGANSVLHGIRSMRDSLAGIVAEVRNGTDSVVHTSAEMASGVMALSSRTEQQAGALEETASAMEQLASTVKQNGENARHANEMVKAASKVASQGGHLVGQVVSTMGDINNPPRQMSPRSCTACPPRGRMARSAPRIDGSMVDRAPTERGWIPSSMPGRRSSNGW